VHLVACGSAHINIAAHRYRITCAACAPRKACDDCAAAQAFDSQLAGAALPPQARARRSCRPGAVRGGLLQRTRPRRCNCPVWAAA
jgi:hypothetical protein